MPANKPIIYLAGPIAGCNWDAAVDWRYWVADQFPECDVRSPMRGKEFLKQLQGEDVITSQPSQYAKIAEKAIDAAVSSQHAIVVRDYYDVKQADILIVNLLPSVDTGIASIGTCFELAWAYMMHKPAVVAMQEVNPNVHPFVQEAAYLVLPSLEEVVAVSRTLLNLPIIPGGR